MCLSLLNVNVCQFDDCGLRFANLHDLLHHIEDVHIPPIEEKMMKEEHTIKTTESEEDSSKDEIEVGYPLSVVHRFFRKLPPEKPVPIKREIIKLAIGHYRPVARFSRKKPILSAVTNGIGHGYSGIKRFDQREISNDPHKSQECVDHEKGTDERRYKCPVEGCNKRYKNLQGARYHARQIHGYDDSNNANSAVSFDLTAAVPGQVAPLIRGTSSKYSNLRPYKCSQCSKRYKTIVGLNNHVQQTHQRINSVVNSALSTNLVPVSPSAVSISANNIATPPAATHIYVRNFTFSKNVSESNEHITVPPNYLAPTSIQNAAQLRVNTQAFHSFSSSIGHQYQQQQTSAVTKILSVASNTAVKNMNVLSAYGPQTSTEVIASVSRQPDVPQILGNRTVRNILRKCAQQTEE
ncbi:unnamed protein product [Thelazia callipaeda]|uniref:C2H2-type domain-containing protein n=1 Tax=Thelazia callipaeda TaxID=103827 RepID=A0A0N5D3K2_THECL|nr:unnamed protein product [Thelazia callipaeda]